LGDFGRVALEISKTKAILQQKDNNIYKIHYIYIANLFKTYIAKNTHMFKKPFSFEGRIRRTEYGITLIAYMAFAVALNVVTAATAGGLGSGAAAGLGALALLYIPMVWILWAQGAKRCHDVGKSGWWQLIPFYPFVLVFQDGDLAPNEYGHNPKVDPSDDLIDSIGNKEI